MSGGAEIRRWVDGWWRGDLGFAGKVLGKAVIPLELGFRAASRLRGILYESGVWRTTEAPFPVISIGNLTVGGTGKTPVAAWVARCLGQWGRRPAIGVRGYGVDEIEVHRWLNPTLPVLAGRSRAALIPRVLAGGGDCLVLDDGFQHRAIARDLDIVILAAEQWGEERRMLPRGIWREPLESLRRADCIVVTRKSASAEAADGVLLRLQERGLATVGVVAHLAADDLEPLWSAEDEPPLGITLEGLPVLAVTSLAEPRPFLKQLEHAGAIVESVSFPDHYIFKPRDVDAILARRAERLLVMTLKEAVKLRLLLPVETPAVFVSLRVEIERGRNQLEAALRRALGAGDDRGS